MWNTLWNAALPSLTRMLLPDPHQVRDRVRRGVGQVDGVLLRDHQGVSADDRADVEDREVVVILVDADGGGIAGDDGAEHARHTVTLAGDGRGQVGEYVASPAPTVRGRWGRRAVEA
jgi:hypothetical protein